MDTGEYRALLRKLRPEIERMVNAEVEARLAAREDWVTSKVLTSRVEAQLGRKTSWLRHRLPLLYRKQLNGREFLYECNSAMRALTNM